MITEEEMQYVITKEECQSHIDKAGKVCSSCGGKLEPIETEDNGGNPTHWVGCMDCCKFGSGVNKEVYDIAVYLVDERGYTPYTMEGKPNPKTRPADYDYWRKSQISGTTYIVRDVLNYIEKKK